jgi:hypothetical protein
LEQSAEIPDIRERRNARRSAARESVFRCEPGFPQLEKRTAPEQSREQQAVRFQRTPDLQQRAWKIIDEVKGKRRYGKVERRIGKRQRVELPRDARRIRLREKPLGRIE